LVRRALIQESSWSSYSSSVSQCKCSCCTDLGVCRVVSLTYSHSSLLLQLLLHSDFFPLLNSVIPEVLPLLLVGSALASGGSVLDPWLCRTRGKLWQLLTEATPVVVPPPPPNQATQTQCSFPNQQGVPGGPRAVRIPPSGSVVWSWEVVPVRAHKMRSKATDRQKPRTATRVSSLGGEGSLSFPCCHLYEARRFCNEVHTKPSCPRRFVSLLLLFLSAYAEPGQKREASCQLRDWRLCRGRARRDGTRGWLRSWSSSPPGTAACSLPAASAARCGESWQAAARRRLPARVWPRGLWQERSREGSRGADGFVAWPLRLGCQTGSRHPLLFSVFQKC